MSNQKRDLNIKWSVLIPALIVVLGVSIPLAVNPESGTAVVGKIFNFITSNLKSVFLWFGFLATVFCFWISFSKWGNIKLGGPEDKPDFSWFTYCAMIFTSGVAIGVVYWPFLEPVYYTQSPPLFVGANTPLAAEYSGFLSLFHWGITAWAFSALPTFPIAYALHVKKAKSLRLSTACSGVLGSYTESWLGRLIDAIGIFAIIGGVGTSLGLAVPLVMQLISAISGIPNTFGNQIILLIVWTAFFTLAVWTGLKKGIAKVADWNTYLAFAILAFVFVTGPTLFMVNLFTNSVGLTITEFFRMSLWSDPVSKSGFPEGWTVFYWAWDAAYGPLMGLFVARISKGRTIREMVMATIFAGAIGCWLFFVVFGGYGVYAVYNKLFDLAGMVEKLSPAAIIVEVMKTLPLSQIVLPLVMIMCFLFVATTLNASAYTLASQCTKELKSNEEPPRWLRTVWGIALGIYAAGLFAVKGLKAVQLSSIIVALPLIPIFIIMVISGMRWIKEDYGQLLQPNIPVLPKENVKPLPSFIESELNSN
ncbi:BCCT family transporter [Moorella sulfitireducens]|uniref:BCCT family transporter n=1 Tax=Neomoorella sulfitireducens TaxID=2972948 RepID=UPI0021AD3E46|nr:BCCT family transporter [Moorella sulfitireducens]